MSQPDAEGLRHITERLFQAHAIDFRDYKPSTLRRRIQRRMEAVGCLDTASYLDRLDADSGEYASLLDSLLINVTTFFREPEAWEVIRSQVIPRILAGKSKGGQIKVWSAGCATGEEPYSLAMLLLEVLGAQAPDYEIKVYATDIDDNALAVARRGEYTDAAVQSVPEVLLRKYFRRNGLWAISRDLRKTVIFGRHNLVSDPPISHCDLIVCRNVLIYMSVSLQNQILSRFHYALESPGYLFLGKAEAMLSLSRLFSSVDARSRIFAKESPGGIATIATPEQMALRRAVSVGSAEHEMVSMFNEEVLRHAPIGVIALNGNSVVRLINPAAERLWGVRSKDLLGKSLRDAPLPPSLQEIADKAPQVVRGKRELVIDEMPVYGERGRQLCASVRMAPMFDVRGGPGGVIIITEDITVRVLLRHELEATNEQLNSTNEELETTNEELQATNEELVTTNEELQSTNEELETTNEELQSTNEELETTNDELEARTAELNEAKSELEARNTALEVLNEALRLETEERAAAQDRLGTILDTVPYGVMVFEGDEPMISLLNPAAAKSLGPNWRAGISANEALEGSKLMWPDGMPMATDDAPTRRALSTGESVSDMEMLYERSDGRRISLLAYAAALTDGSGKPTAGVSAFIDITQRKAAQEDLRRAYDREHRIADTLQRALLSPEQVRIGSMLLDMRYQAASEEAEVGGDFYESVTLADGRVVIALGDVAGKGLEAAVTGALAKNMLVGFAYESPDPATVLQRLNDALCAHLPASGFCTVACLLVDPEKRTVRYAGAGHEPAIHLRAATGEAELLESTGRALGIQPGGSYRVIELTLAPRDILFVHTDGLSEAGPRTHMLGSDGLTSLLRAHLCDDPVAIHEAIYNVAVSLTGARLTDDAASILITWEA